MKEIELFAVKEYKFDNPLFTDIDYKIDKCFRDSQYYYFRNYKYECLYDIKLTNITNNETINFTISDKSMNLYELLKKLTVARQNGFIFDQINKLTKKFYSHLRCINIICYLESQIPLCHRQCCWVISQNRDYVENFWKDMENFGMSEMDQSIKLMIVCNFIFWQNFLN